MTNYAMSHGDNYTCKPVLPIPDPWEDAPPFAVGQVRRGWSGLWGTSGIFDLTGDSGQMRGMGDYRTCNYVDHGGCLGRDEQYPARRAKCCRARMPTWNSGP